MTGVVVVLSVFALGVIGLFVRSVMTRRRRRRLQLLRLTGEQRERLAEDFSLYARLPYSLRDELEGLMHVFIDEKSYEACGGLGEVTGHMRRVIAAQACLLLLNRKHDFYRRLRSVLVYPSAYKARGEHGDEDVRLGESWHSGSVILSWQSVIAGGRNEEDGHHVSLHEFAHQLDQVDGSADGVPELTGAGAYRVWSRVFSKAYDRFTDKVERGKPTVIDEYGATDPAEFFAVATETFYEKPEQLQREYPEVYAQLRQYYQVDPLEWGG